MARFALLGSVRVRPRWHAPPGGAGGYLRLQPTLPGVDWAWQHFQSSDGSIVRTEEPSQYTVPFFPDGTVAIDADVSKLKGAPKTLVAEYSFPYLAHAPMEPLNCTVQLSDKGAEVWTGTQFQTVDQAAIARTLELKPEQVKLHTLMAGGGFGRRAVPTSDYGVEAAQVAKAWRKAGHREPVKVIWSREDDIHGGYYRPMYVHRAEIGLDDKGNILAWNHTIVGQSILAGTPFEKMMSLLKFVQAPPGGSVSNPADPSDVPSRAADQIM